MTTRTQTDRNAQRQQQQQQEEPEQQPEQQQQPGTCPVLNLTLGPLHLNLLGLIIDLDEVHLEIVADPTGGLLGSLVCALSGLLQNLLGGLLNTVLGSLVTAITGFFERIFGNLIGGVAGRLGLNGAGEEQEAAPAGA